MWESLKALLAREVGGAKSPSPTEDPPGCTARGSEWTHWGCLPPGTLAEHVSLAASISLWNWMPPPPGSLVGQGSKHVADGDVPTPSTELACATRGLCEHPLRAVSKAPAKVSCSRKDELCLLPICELDPHQQLQRLNSGRSLPVSHCDCIDDMLGDRCLTVSLPTCTLKPDPMVKVCFPPSRAVNRPSRQ